MICPECKLDRPTLSSSVVEGVYYSKRCNVCVAAIMPAQKPTNTAREFDRNRQRKDFAKDIVQGMVNGKPNADFLKAYPDKAKERFTEQEIRNMQRNISN